MKRKFKPHYVGEKSRKEWWESLTLEQKQKAKYHYMRVREQSLKTKFPYPNLYDVSATRIGKLSEKQIHRIWVFRDRPIN